MYQPNVAFDCGSQPETALRATVVGAEFGLVLIGRRFNLHRVCAIASNRMSARHEGEVENTRPNAGQKRKKPPTYIERASIYPNTLKECPLVPLKLGPEKALVCVEGEMTPRDEPFQTMLKNSETLALYNDASFDQDMLTWMEEREVAYQPPNYIGKHKHITAKMRAILLDWMQEICFHFGLKRETFQMAANYVDRYLGSRLETEKSHLQALGVGSMFIAAKIEEILPPHSSNFISTTAGCMTEDDLFLIENRILSVLDWDLLPKTHYCWAKFYLGNAVQQLLHQSGSDENINQEKLLQTMRTVLSMDALGEILELLDIALLDKQCLDYRPSFLSRCAIVVIIPSVKSMRYLLESYCVAYLTGEQHRDMEMECCEWLASLRDVPFNGIVPIENDERPVDPLHGDLLTRQMYNPDALFYLYDK